MLLTRAKLSVPIRRERPSSSAVHASRSLVGSDLFVGFPHLPFRNVERLCPIHGAPPVPGWLPSRAEQRNPFAPAPLLTDIPFTMQAAYGIGPEAETVFAQRETGLYRDGLRLASGRFVSLQDLPQGVGAYIPTLLERSSARRVRASQAVD